jgi:MFS family permease
VSGPPRGAALALDGGIALLFTGFFMTGTLAPLLGAALGAPPAVIGVVVSAAFAFPLLLAIPVGGLIDRVGAKPVLLGGAGLLTLAPLLVVAGPTLPGLLVVQVLAGLGQLLGVVAAQSLVASFGVGRDRERHFGWYGAFVSTGQMAGPIAAGVLLDLAGFRVAYLVAAVAAVAAFGFFVAIATPARRATTVAEERDDRAERTGQDAVRPERSEHDAEGPAEPPSAERPARRSLLASPRLLAGLLRLPTVQVSLWASGTAMIVLTVHNSFVPAFLGERAVAATLIGAIVSARSLASVLVRPFMPRVVAALGGRLRTFLVMLGAAALGVAAIAFGPLLPLLLASSLVLGVAVGVAQPLTMVAMVDEVDPASHGTAFGLRITANRLAQFTSPLLLGLVAQLLGYPAMFAVAAAAIAATATLLAARRGRYGVIDRVAG